MTTSSASEIFRLLACDVKVPSVVPCYCVLLLCQMLQAYFLNRLQRKVTIFLDFTLDHEPKFRKPTLLHASAGEYSGSPLMATCILWSWETDSLGLTIVETTDQNDIIQGVRVHFLLRE
jgi:hypothetical protein